MPHCDTVNCRHYQDNGHGRPVRVCTPRDPCPLLAWTLEEPPRKYCYFLKGKIDICPPLLCTVKDALQLVRNAGRTPHIQRENAGECVIAVY